MHTHALASVLPTGELAFTTHIVQTLVEVVSWYVPIGQLAHIEEPDVSV